MKEHESVLVFSRGKWTYNRQMQARAPSGAARVKTPVKLETKSDNYRAFERVERKILPELRVPSSVQKFNRERGLHPTQKPVGLFEYLIKTYTNAGELVLYTHAGSGTTAVACVNTGRSFIGSEISRDYHAAAVDRIKSVMESKGLAFRHDGQTSFDWD